MFIASDPDLIFQSPYLFFQMTNNCKVVGSELSRIFYVNGYMLVENSIVPKNVKKAPLRYSHLKQLGINILKRSQRALCVLIFPPGSNFINILRANFSYKRLFGSFSLVTYKQKKLPKRLSYKEFAPKPLMKLTTELTIFLSSLSQ